MRKYPLDKLSLTKDGYTLKYVDNSSGYYWIVKPNIYRVQWLNTSITASSIEFHEPPQEVKFSTKDSQSVTLEEAPTLDNSKEYVLKQHPLWGTPNDSFLGHHDRMKIASAGIPSSGRTNLFEYGSITNDLGKLQCIAESVGIEWWKLQISSLNSDLTTPMVISDDGVSFNTTNQYQIAEPGEPETIFGRLHDDNPLDSIVTYGSMFGISNRYFNYSDDNAYTTFKVIFNTVLPQEMARIQLAGVWKNKNNGNTYVQPFSYPPNHECVS